MKIRVKGFKSLIKAVQNRAHLFPVKVLVNGKNKTFYSIRYKSGNKAMEMAKKDMKIPANAEAIFDTKDGKKKGLSEKDVLNLYEKAGKKGSLQDFIVANFKRPKIKEDGQMNINDLMNQVDNKKEQKQEKPNSYGQLSKYQFRRLQQKGSSLWDKNGEKRLYFNNLGSALAEKIAKETDATDATFRRLNSVGKNLFYNMDEGKFYSKFNENEKEEAQSIFEEAKRLLEELKQEETNNPKDTNRLSDNLNLTASQEKSLLEKLGVDVDIEDLYSKTIVKPDIGAIEELIGKKYSKIGDEIYSKAATSRINETLYNLRYDVNKNQVIGDTKDREGIRDMVQKAIDNLIEDLKRQQPEEPEKPVEPEEKLAFRNVGMDGGLINFIKLREGTTRVVSNNEYKQVKNINELVDQVKSIKDAHTKIKGRAIMDMFGIDADLYVKAGNRLFPLGTGAVGYCTKQYDSKTDRSHIVEIGLVADRNNVVAETKTAIHECMHAKLKHSINKVLSQYKLINEKRREPIRHDIEETIVEIAGQGVSNLIHGNGTDKELWSYDKIIAQVAPMIWGTPEFAEARKNGLHGIGQEICKRLINNDTGFVQNVVGEYFESQIDNELNGKIENRMQTIEWAITGNQYKVEKIQNDTGKSEIANLVEELKKGTISLEGALNSSQYRELAAILITKFLEDEDLDILEGAANEIKYGNVDSAEMMASGRIPF